MNRDKSASPACPCGRLDARCRPLAYAACRGRYLDAATGGEGGAPDAEALMRSRYTAFVLERADYLLATWHPGKRPSEPAFDSGARWLGLDARSHRRVDDCHAEVDFVARYRLGGKAARLAERSRFVRENGHWLYVDGALP